MLTRHQPHEILTGPTRTAPPLPDREAQANAEVGHTQISQPLAWSLTLFLLAIIVAVPVIQVFQSRQIFEIFPALPAAVRTFAQQDGSLWAKANAANRSLLQAIQSYEDALEQASVVSSRIRPPTQAWLSRWLGAGNEKVYLGRAGWLFYRPDIELLTGPPFLAPQQLARRAASGSETRPAPQPDPRLAILEFHQQLAERGSQLLLLPAPAKSMVHPEKFHRGAPPLYNESWPALRDSLEQAGVLVFDPAPLIVSNGLAYLATDTHWRPETMEVVAQALAQFIRERVPGLPAATDPQYSERVMTVTNQGDTAVMLQVEFPPESVQIRQVRQNNHRWEAEETAEVLLLGDSFANIYSSSEMKWGSAAGLAERLSWHLRRPLDVMIRNDDGAHATRLLYAMAQAQSPERLAPKRLVIWQFAARELASGDWKRLSPP